MYFIPPYVHIYACILYIRMYVYVCILVQSLWDQDKPYPKRREKAETHSLFQKFSQKEWLMETSGCLVMSENFVCI